MSGPVRIGVLGFAEIAKRRVLPAIGRTPGAEIAAIASRDAGRAARAAAAFGGRPVHGYAALLALAEVDAVYVPLPAALHAEWVRAALLAGKHVLAEKPLTTDPRATAELLALAQRSGLALMENIMFPQHSQHTQARKLLADGAIGEVRSFQSAFTIPPRPAGDIRYQSTLDGGALWDLGVYPLRAATLLLGTPLAVAGAFLTRGESGVDVSGAALLRAPGGVAAHLVFGLEHAYRSSYEVCGSRGRLSVDNAFTPAGDHRPRLRLHRDEQVQEIVLPPDDQVANTVATFVSAVRAGVCPAPEASLELARLLAEIRSRA